MKFSELLQSSITNLVPYWSINLLQYFQIGNEYNPVITLIFNQITKYILILNDEICILIILSILILTIIYKMNIFSNINFFSINRFVLKGFEIYSKNSYECRYSDEIHGLIEYIINVKNYKDIMIINDVKTLNDTSNIKVSNKIYLSVSRKISQETSSSSNMVTFTLTSYGENIKNFLDIIAKDYRNKHFSEMVLIGSETNKAIQYPEYILAINFYVLKVKNIYFPKLICMNSYKFDGIAENNDDNKDNNSANKSNKTESLFCLNNISNFKLDENIEMTIYRNNEDVNYILRSKTIQCKDWLENILNIYQENKNCKFKNKLIMYGSEKNTDSFIGHITSKIISYSNIMLTINWYVIEKLGYQKYEYIEDRNLIYNYILDSIPLLKIDEDLYLEIDKEVCKMPHSSNKKHNNNQNVKYTIFSNNKNIKKCIDSYILEFNKIKKKSNKLYHFTYNGFNNNDLPSFNTNLLSEKDTNNELFETFDKMCNEYSEKLVNDIDELNDTEFYKKHGLKRKKGYLFYGEPGCGKTSSVVAMALYGNRHIVEISFSQLKTNEDFEKIMNLKAINNIEISNNNIILLFDEINYGFDKINKNNDRGQQNFDSINSLAEVISGKEIIDEKQTKLNIGTILSKLDGIKNYNGLIIVATTNFIDKLEPALYRDMRLTPIEFKKLRICDCINIIKSYYDITNFESTLNAIIKDRKITPARLVSLCSTHCKSNSFENFLEIIKKEFI